MAGQRQSREVWNLSILFEYDRARWIKHGRFSVLVTFMTEGPVVTLVLASENAIAKWRDLMGATNPANAAEGTIRKRFAENIERNCVHGSDAPETVAVEIPFFFAANELI